MKKSFLLCCIMASAIGFAQETTSNNPKETSIFDRKHEIKVGAIKLLAGTIFEGTYEYIHSKNFTYGSSLLVNFDKNSAYPEDFSITPFARFYFQETKEYGAKGFFVEGFTKFYTGKYVPNSQFYPGTTQEKYSAGAIGLALGKKWINSSGFVFEILGGVGRTIGSGASNIDAVFRGDLSIGYRF